MEDNKAITAANIVGNTAPKVKLILRINPSTNSSL